VAIAEILLIVALLKLRKGVIKEIARKIALRAISLAKYHRIGGVHVPRPG